MLQHYDFVTIISTILWGFFTMFVAAIVAGIKMYQDVKAMKSKNYVPELLCIERRKECNKLFRVQLDQGKIEFVEIKSIIVRNEESSQRRFETMMKILTDHLINKNEGKA